MHKDLYTHLKYELIFELLFSERQFCRAAYALNHPTAQQDWERAEKELLLRVPGIHLEHLYALRDALIACPERGIKSLQEILSTQAQLLVSGLSTAQAGADEAFDGLSQWRWMAFALPADLMVATLGQRVLPLGFKQASPLLERHWLQHGLAQTHVHLGAQTDFPTYWASAMQALASEEVTPHALSSPGAAFAQGHHFAPWLLAGAIARLLLYGFLLQRQRHPIAGFRDYLHQVAQQLVQRFWPDAGLGLQQVIHSLCQPGQLPEVGFYDMRTLYALLLPDPCSVRGLQDVWLLDPLVRMGSGDIPIAERESHSHCLGFAYINSEQGAQDDLFACLFWQVMRLKVLFYRHLVQRPAVKGLQWFIRHYERIAALAKPAKKFRLAQAFDLDGGEQGLRSLEVRIAPDEDPGEIRQKVFQSAQTWLRMPERGQTEVGLVVHLPKERSVERPNLAALTSLPHHWCDTHANPQSLLHHWCDTHANPQSLLHHWCDTHANPQSLPHHWCDTHANPQNHSSHYRYSRYTNKTQRKVNAYVQHLQQVPLSIALVRGIDMCTDEISIPNWVMAYLLAQMHQAGQQAAHALRYLYPAWKIPAPHKTMHIGEDFFHLLDGIRRMDEVIEHFPLERGDRIGHGLALGLSPRRWCEQHPIVWMPKEIRLWDLIWEWRQYTQGRAEAAQSRLENIKDKIARYIQEIFGPVCTVADICQLYTDLFDSDRLQQVGFPNGEQVHLDLRRLSPDNRRSYWLYYYLTDSRCFEQSYQMIEVHNSAAEQAALAALQRAVRQRVCQRNITIEVNPSSNFLIADLQNLEHHPLWNLKPPPGHQPEADMGPPLNICIGSDDPITFATNLPQEYELLYNVLLQKGLSENDALQWLDQVRQTGLNARFTLSFGPQHRDADQVWQQLLKDLKADWVFAA